MALPDLFLKDTKGFSESLIKLPQDLDLWAEKIVTIIKQKIPEAKNMKISVHFLKKSEELGTATGAVTLYDKKINKQVYLPIVVNNFTMYPLDIMMIHNDSMDGDFNIVPFDLETFREELENSNPFSTLSKPMDRLKQMYMNPSNQTIYPPAYRHVYAAQEGTILSAVDGTVDKEDTDEMKEKVLKHKKALKNYEGNANLGLVSKSLNLKESEEDEDDESKGDNGDDTKIKTAMIRKVSSVEAEVLTTSCRVFKPIRTMADAGKMIVSENSEVILDTNVPEESGSTIKIVSTNLNDRKNAKTLSTDMMSKSYGIVQVNDVEGMVRRGVVFKNTLDMITGKVSNPLFINQDIFSHQDKFVTYYDKDHVEASDKIEHYVQVESDWESIIPGSRVVFVAVIDDAFSKEKSIVVTSPVEVRGFTQVSEYRMMINCANTMGQQMQIETHNPNGDLYPITKDRNVNLLDTISSYSKSTGVRTLKGSVKLVILKGRSLELQRDVKSPLEKISAAKHDPTMVRVININPDTFALKGGMTEKMAAMSGWDSNYLKPEEVSFLLSAKNCPMSKIAMALRVSGGDSRECFVTGLPLPVFEKAQIKTASQVALERFKKQAAAKLKINLFKEASVIQDSQVVDSVLSLNFINEKNLSQFISFIPLLKQTSGILARLVLASRLGVEEISKNDVSAAMQGVIKVVKGLEKLKGLNEKNASAKVASIETKQTSLGRVSILDFL